MSEWKRISDAVRVAHTVPVVDVGWIMFVEPKDVYLIQKSIIGLKNNYHKSQGGAEFVSDGDIDLRPMTVAPRVDRRDCGGIRTRSFG